MTEKSSKWRNRAAGGALSGLCLFAFYGCAADLFKPDPESVDYTTFLNHARQGYYSKVTIAGSHAESNVVYGKKPKSDLDIHDAYSIFPSHENTEIPAGDNLFERIKDDTKVYVEPPADPGNSWKAIAIRYFPFALIAGVFIAFYASALKKGKEILNFKKPKGIKPVRSNVRLSDIAGIDESKEELKEVIDFLQSRNKYTAIGARSPKGVLLIGSPGVGKTLLAKAIAGESGVAFYALSGSEFSEIFVGVGASRVRDIFEDAKKNSPCVIFIDEIDSVGRKRGEGQGQINDEREQTLNQILVEMDGFESSDGIILIAATNRPDLLDPALTRPGRFDRQVEVPKPDVLGRAQILAVHAKKIKMAPDVNLDAIARGTPGFSGADLANIVNEAALLAARRGAKQAFMEDFEAAKDKVMMGVERKSAVISENDKLVAAYHQAGHALVTMHTPDAIPLYKTTITPRGQNMGKTFQVPSGDMLSLNRSQIDAILTVSMGGRVAELLAFGKDQITSSAADDIKKARDLAYEAVTKWGMSDRLGPVLFTKGSNAHLAIVDQEVNDKIMTAFKKASKILTTRRHDLDILAQALLVQETLTEKVIRAALQITHELEDIQKSPEPV